MNLFLLAACLSLLAYGAVSAVASLALLPVMRRAVAATRGRKGSLFLLRYLPTVLALSFTGVIVLPAFLRFEPPRSGERVGPLMLSLAGASLLVLLAGAWRGLRAALATRSLARRWRAGATAIDLPGAPVPAFAIDGGIPGAAVVGILRPRLFVARHLLRHCSEREVRAIVAHETAHVLGRDNLKRLLLRSSPDLLALSPIAGALERAWVAAGDRAADDHAARRGSRLDLAAALVKVARAANAPTPEAGVLASLCGGDDIARRVRRLLSRAPMAGEARSQRLRMLPLLLAVAGVAGVVVARGDAVGPGVHSLSESVVRLLQ